MELVIRPSLRRLLIFAAVAKLKSFHRAADAVHLSQPAVTLAIQKLEAQMGCALFERSNNGSFLSPAGDILAARVGSMFDQIETALTDFGIKTKGDNSPASIAERITRPQLKILAFIAEGKSLGEAAQKIGISSGTLHRSVRELGCTLGRSLLQSSVNGVMPTAAGTRLASKLVLALREIDWALEEISSQLGQLRGSLNIGVMPLAGNFLVAPVINDLKKLFPRTHVQVRTRDGSHLIKSLQLGEVDFIVGLIGRQADGEILREHLVSSPYVIVARRNHPLTRQMTISVADLARQEWIAPLPGATRRAVFDNLFQSCGRDSQADIETYALSTIQLLLRGSDRLAFLTEFEFRLECDRGGGFLIVLPFGPIKPLQTLGVTMRRKGTLTPLQLKFLELIRQHAKAIDLPAGTLAARRPTSTAPH